MADPFVAEIRVFPFNFAPRGWAFCNGQILPISQNTALFSLLGVNYGGNGQSNFGLPNLQGASPIGEGQGPGLSLRSLGETGGAATVTLLESQVPSHTHTLQATSTATTTSPAGAALAPVSAGGEAYRAAPTNTTLMGSDAIGAVGGAAHNNRQPYLALNFCIALQGVFPPRP